MVYDSGELSFNDLLQPVVAAEDALARLDDRVGRKNDLGETNGRRTRDGLLRENEGWIERSHFVEACNALWLAGELVHVEDLVLHDARMDIRTPTHELTRAHAILRTRRQIAASPPPWPFSSKGLASLRGRAISELTVLSQENVPAVEPVADDELEVKSDAENAFEDELAKLDALLVHASRLLAQPVEAGGGGEGANLQRRTSHRMATRWYMIRIGMKMRGSSGGWQFMTGVVVCRHFLQLQWFGTLGRISNRCNISTGWVQCSSPPC